MSNPDALTIISLAATVLFGVLSVVFFLRSRRHKKLAFVWSRAELQARAHPDVAISFRGVPVDNLSVLRFACWNCGSKEIRWDDIPKGHPPRVAFQSDRILSVASNASSRHNGFQIQHSDNGISMRFGFLNPGDFGLVEVLYEARPERKFPAVFSAPVIGGLPLTVGRFVKPMGRPEFTTLIVLPLLVTVVGVYSAIVSAFRLPDWTTPKAVGGFVLGGAAMILGTVGVIANAQNRRHQRVPALAREFLAGDLRPNTAMEPTARN